MTVLFACNRRRRDQSAWRDQGTWLCVGDCLSSCCGVVSLEWTTGKFFFSTFQRKLKVYHLVPGKPDIIISNLVFVSILFAWGGGRGLIDQPRLIYFKLHCHQSKSGVNDSLVPFTHQVRMENDVWVYRYSDGAMKVKQVFTKPLIRKYCSAISLFYFLV